MLAFDSPVAKELKLSGKPNLEAQAIITQWLEQRDLGQGRVTYKLRDWLFSRQRYWGEPIPVVHWEDGSMTSLEDKDLPLTLPELADYKPSDGGESPLAKAKDWLDVVDKKSGLRGRRETNTMPQWAGSCWYYLRFIDPKNGKHAWDPELEKAWMPVDLYVGGAEHAVLHLLYARFWHKVLFDLGYVSTKEPFYRLFNQGMIQAFAYKNKRNALVPVDQVEESADGSARFKETGEVLTKIIAKMSKSLRNVVTLDEIVEKFGADTFRVYLMFMGPLDTSRVWDTQAIMGSNRFLRKAWAFVTGNQEQGVRPLVEPTAESKALVREVNRLVKKITADIETLNLNTCISSMMEFLNTVSDEQVSKATLEKFILLLSPFAPHIAEELWQLLGHKQTLAYEAWPTFDEALIHEDSVKVVVQVNGKKRALVEVPVGIDEAQLKKAVIAEMSSTDYKVTEADRFITVFAQGTTQPKLVNVLTGK